MVPVKIQLFSFNTTNCPYSYSAASTSFSKHSKEGWFLLSILTCMWFQEAEVFTDLFQHVFDMVLSCKPFRGMKLNLNEECQLSVLLSAG